VVRLSIYDGTTLTPARWRRRSQTICSSLGSRPSWRLRQALKSSPEETIRSMSLVVSLVRETPSIPR